MEVYTADQIGIDLLSEYSFGWYIADQMDSSGFFVAYRSDDGTTPVNVINGFSWLDDLEIHSVVKRNDYTSYRDQIPLPIVSYDFLNDSDESIEIGSRTKNMIYTLGIIICAENKAQVVNLSGFITTILRHRQIPIYNYNVDGYPQIGVIKCEDVFSSRLFDAFSESNLAKNFTISVTCDAVAEFNNSFER